MAYVLHPLFNGRVVSTNDTNFFVNELVDKEQEIKIYKNIAVSVVSKYQPTSHGNQSGFMCKITKGSS